MRLGDQFEDILVQREYYLNFYSLRPWRVTTGINLTPTFYVPPPPPEAVYVDRTLEMLTWADYFKATVGLPRIPPWADHVTLVPSDETTAPPCGIECSRVLQLEWQSDIHFWNKPDVNANRNHLLEWIERIP
eukprot:5063593-Heterocapsa_arctica.AAC.1